jgi:hypothetical protein
MRERRELILPGPPPPPMPPRSSAAGEARRAGNLGSVRVGDAGRRDLGLGSFSPLLLCFFAEFVRCSGRDGFLPESTRSKLGAGCSRGPVEPKSPPGPACVPISRKKKKDDWFAQMAL